MPYPADFTGKTQSPTSCHAPHLSPPPGEQWAADREPFGTWAHLSADVFGLLRELVRVLLLVLAHPPVHLLPLHSLLTFAERRLALDHFEHQAAQPPPVRTEGVALVLDHLWSWGGETGESGRISVKFRRRGDRKTTKQFLPMYPTVPTLPRIVSPSGIWTARPRSEIRMCPEGDKGHPKCDFTKKVPTLRRQQRRRRTLAAFQTVHREKRHQVRLACFYFKLLVALDIIICIYSFIYFIQ